MSKLDVAAEFANGSELLKALRDDKALCVSKWSLIGSAMYMPADQVSDVDFAVLLRNDIDASDFVCGLIDRGWGKCGDYDGQNALWYAVRRDNLNFMITANSQFYDDYLLAMEVCKVLRLEKKADRIAVCKVVRDKKSAEFVWALQKHEAMHDAGEDL